MLHEIKVNIFEVNEKMNVCNKEIEPTKKTNKRERDKKERRKTPELKSKYLKKFTDWVQYKNEDDTESVSELENKSI